AIVVASFVLCCLLTPAARYLAKRWGLVDNPDLARKLHRMPTPVAGGVAIFVSCAIVLGFAFFTDHLIDDSIPLLGLLLACAFLCAVGVADDFRALRGRYKLIGQIMAVIIVMAFDVRVTNIA